MNEMNVKTSFKEVSIQITVMFFTKRNVDLVLHKYLLKCLTADEQRAAPRQCGCDQPREARPDGWRPRQPPRQTVTQRAAARRPARLRPRPRDQGAPDPAADDRRGLAAAALRPPVRGHAAPRHRARLDRPLQRVPGPRHVHLRLLQRGPLPQQLQVRLWLGLAQLLRHAQDRGHGRRGQHHAEDGQVAVDDEDGGSLLPLPRPPWPRVPRRPRPHGSPILH